MDMNKTQAMDLLRATDLIIQAMAELTEFESDQTKQVIDLYKKQNGTLIRLLSFKGE